MSQETFEGATIVVDANVYYDGRVTSRELVTADGVRKTLGIILPGEYEFESEDEEAIEIRRGTLDVTLPGEDPTTVGPGETVVVPPGTTFTVETDDVVDYCCTYR